MPKKIEAIKTRTPRRKKEAPIPLIPLSKHRLIPAILQSLEQWRNYITKEEFVEKFKMEFIERVRLELDSAERDPLGRLRVVLERTTFSGELPPTFDTRKFHYLTNLMLWEVEFTESDDPEVRVERREWEIEAALNWIENHWRESRLMMPV